MILMVRGQVVLFFLLVFEGYQYFGIFGIGLLSGSSKFVTVAHMIMIEELRDVCNSYWQSSPDMSITRTNIYE